MIWAADAFVDRGGRREARACPGARSRREGYGVDVARTGDEGLERASEESYDAIVLDLMLPGVDGVDLCQTLRRRGHWVPVLMLTARGEVGDRIRGLDSGADDYLVKPFDFGELLARLRALIRPRAVRAPALDRDRRPADRPRDAHRHARRPPG
jgi:DNA-binding response OmpR family regulator